MKFKVGDKVRFTRDFSERNKELVKGDIVTVVTLKPFEGLLPINAIGLESEKKLSFGHDLGGCCEDGFGFFAPEEIFELIESEDSKIKIGSTVILNEGAKALGWIVGKKNKGVVIGVHPFFEDVYLVEYEEPVFEGHDGTGGNNSIPYEGVKGKDGHCIFMNVKWLDEIKGE